MLRMLFVFFLVLFIALTTIEFVGLVPDRFGSVGRMNDLLSLLAIFFVVLSFGAIAWSRAVNRLFRKPLEREYRTTPKRRDREDAKRTQFMRALIMGICTVEGSREASPAQLIASARQQSSFDAGWPWKLPELALWAQRAENRLKSNLILRFLVSERMLVITSRLRALHDYAAGFPVAPPGLAETKASSGSAQQVKRDQTRNLVRAIESHTGASVLATGLHTRSGVDTVRLWHSDRLYEARPETETNTETEVSPGAAKSRRIQSSKTYAELHLAVDPPSSDSDAPLASNCIWEQRMQESNYYLIGDRDKHVPIVDGVTLSENRWAGTVEFVLSTHSSCFAATDHSPHACKGMIEELSAGDPDEPIWVEEGRVVKRNYGPDNELETNLAVHVAIVITDEHNERFLALIRRSNTNRFGNRMLTVPGETLALAAGGAAAYVDEFGAPDLTGCALSAVRNTLGLDLASTQLRPSHVIMVNQRESTVSATEGRSQLVCTVGFFTNLTMTRKELEAHRVSTQRMGHQGIQSLSFLPLGNASRGDREHDAQLLLSKLQEHQSSMDQMSTTASLVVAARLLSPQLMLQALENQIDSSWCAQPWEGESHGQPRVAVPLDVSRVIRA